MKLTVSLLERESAIKEWLSIDSLWAYPCPKKTYKDNQLVIGTDGRETRLRLYRAEAFDQGDKHFRQFLETMIGSLVYRIAYDLADRAAVLESFPVALPESFLSRDASVESRYVWANGPLFGLSIDRQYFDYRYTLDLLLAIWEE